MLYLSLILIACGIFVVIYTILSAAKKEEKKPVPSDKPPIERTPEEKDDVSGNEDEGLSLADTLTAEIEKEEPGDKMDLFAQAPDLADSTGKEEENIIQEELIEEQESDAGNSDNANINELAASESSAVLYEDSSSVIDYDSNKSLIDPTATEYKKIKRIGEGELAVADSGLMFKAGNKLFRFDFRRMSDIKFGDNFVAVILKGSDVSRLFIFKKKTKLGGRLKQLYNNYLSNVL